MPSLIPGGVLGDMRRIENSTMDWRATIARSGLVTPCCISFDTRPVHIEGLPSFIHIARWVVTMQDGTDLRAGDILAVQKPNGSLWATVGSYTVLETMNPTTISVSASGFAVMTSDVNGNVPMFDAKDTVTFRSSQTDKDMEAKVFLFDASRDLALHDDTPGYEWGVLFDNRLRYPANNVGETPAIVADDGINAPNITATALSGTRKTAISRPRPHPLLPVSIAYFSERP